MAPVVDYYVEAAARLGDEGVEEGDVFLGAGEDFGVCYVLGWWVRGVIGMGITR